MTRELPLSEILQRAGLRATPQRLAILHLLRKSTQHPTAQMIYEQLEKEYPSLSLATVYNTLEAFVNQGMINTLGSTADGSVHYDADTSPHVNLSCTNCHQVIDLPSKYVHALDEEVAQNSGYQILGARVLYYGLCPECQKRSPRPN